LLFVRPLVLSATRVNNDGTTNGNPYAQIDLSTSISETNKDGTLNWRTDGF
jgi:hypothetical protein